MSMSFTHFMPVSRPDTASIARHTATAARGVMSSASSAEAGSSRRLIYNPPSGEAKERPMRPRPALCESATSAVPARASAASSSAVFVEAVPAVKRMS